jgi:diadenosine tetraphosphate (Ap4A) HIT family hydrolase
LTGAASICDLPLSHARLHLDARFPWIVLIPRRSNLLEIEDLDADGRRMLTEEIVLAGLAVRSVGAAIGFSVQKLNVGALGNIVTQLHVHVVGRRIGDRAWPGPVWGAGEAEPYAEASLSRALAAAREAMYAGSPA